MYAPFPYKAGSSVSHFDTALSPDEIMEPFYTSFSPEIGLALDVLLDIGWSLNPANIPNSLPVLTEIGALTTNEDTSLSVSLSATDENNDELTFSAETDSDNISVAVSGSTLTIIPAANFYGTANLTVSVSDGEDTVSEEVNLTVTAVNDAPVFGATPAAWLYEDTVSIISLSATDIDDTELTFEIVSAISELNSSIAGNQLTLNPVSDYYGDSSITVQVSDGILSDQATFTVQVYNVNDKPLLGDIAPQTVQEDSTLSVQLSATDVDSENLSFIISSSTEELNASINGSVVLLAPVENFTGEGEVTVSVTDGSETDEKTFSVSVTPVNDAPTLIALPDQAIDEENELTIQLSGSDIDSESLSYSASSSTTDISVSVSGNQLTLSPANNYHGTSQITVMVSDGELSADSTFTLTVNGVNDAPVLENPGAQSVAEDGLLSLTLTATDAEGDALNYSAEADSENLTITVIGNKINIRPDMDHTGTHTVTASVSDGNLSSSVSFELSVTAVNDAPEIQPIGNKEFDINSGLSLALNATDVDDDELIFTATSSNPAMIAVNIVGQSLILGAADTYNATAVITVSVTDGELSDSFEFLATVTGGQELTALLVTINSTTDGTTEVQNHSVLEYTTVGNIALAVTGGDGQYTFNVTFNGSNRNDLLTGSGASRTLTVPDTGAFAGTYTVLVDDAHPQTAPLQFSVRRPVRLSTDVTPLLAGSSSSLLIVEGAPAGENILLAESEMSFLNDEFSTISTLPALTENSTESVNVVSAYINAPEAGTFNISASLAGASTSTLEVDVIEQRTLQLIVSDEQGSHIDTALVTLNDERVESWGLTKVYDKASGEFSDGTFEIRLPDLDQEIRIEAIGFNSQVITSGAGESLRDIQLSIADGYYHLVGRVTFEEASFYTEQPVVTITLADGNVTTPSDINLVSANEIEFEWITEIANADPVGISVSHSAAETFTQDLDSSLGYEGLEINLISVESEEAPDNTSPPDNETGNETDSGTDNSTGDGSQGGSGGGNAAWLLICAIALLRRRQRRA